MVAYLYTEYHEHQWHMPCPYEAEKAANQHECRYSSDPEGSDLVDLQCADNRLKQEGI